MDHDGDPTGVNRDAVRGPAAFRLGLALFVLLCAQPLSSLNLWASDERPALVIIGATAQSAAALIPLAIERGYAVIAVARNPDSLSTRGEHLTVVKGDVYDRASIEAVLTGRETVIGLIGPRVDPRKDIGQSDLFATGYANIVGAMKTRGNKRLIATSSIGAQIVLTRQPAEDAPRTQQWMWKTRAIYDDMRLMETAVRASGLEFTILRPAQLMPEPERHDLQVAVDERAPEFTLITYADFARFILDNVVAGEQHIGHTVALYSDRKLEYGGNFLTGR